MIKPLLFLAFIAFSAACITTQISQKESFAARGYDYIDCSRCDDLNACTTDFCLSKDGSIECIHENVVCHPSEKLCNDGYLASCSNYCNDGLCTTCTPDCGGHECKEISKQCPDGSTARCKEEYTNGTCIECEPQCKCTPKYSCSAWGECKDGFHSRICVDMNRCAEDKKEVKECAAMIKEDISQKTLPQSSQQQSQTNVQFIEIMYDPATDARDEYVILSGSGDLSGWAISDNSDTLVFPQGTVISGKLIIARNPETFPSIYGCQPHVIWPMRGLNNDGDQLTLKDSNGQERDFVAWEKGADDAYPDWTVSAKKGSALRKNGEWHEASPGPC